MALPAMISDYSKQQSERFSNLGQSLAQLGQQVGQQLAMREYQRQATAVLPAMQANYKQAFESINRGDYADGYMKMMETNLQFGADQNPFLASAAKQATEMLALAGKQTQSEAWRMQQAGGGGGGGTTLPVMLDDEELPTLDADIDQPVSEMDGVEEPVNVSDFIAKLSKDEKNPQWKTALQEARDLATSSDQDRVEFRNEIQKQVKDYNELAQQEQLNRLQSRTFDVDAVPQDKVKRVPGSERVVGPGVVGILFNPKSRKTGTTVGQSGKPSSAYKKENIDTLYNQFNGSVSKLNEGEYGDFFEKAGGVFNTELRDDKFVANDGSSIELPVEDRDASSMRTAYEQLKRMPGALNVFDVSDAGFAYKRKKLPEGPTRGAATGMAQLPTAPTQRRPLNTLLPRK